MKTMEELELMPIPALRGIVLNLTGNEPQAKISKAKLVQLVYDLQQPDASEPAREPEKSDEPATGGEEKEADASELSVDENDDLVGESLPPRKNVNLDVDNPTRQQVLDAVAHLGISTEVDDDGVTFIKGEKRTYVSTKQPLRRILSTAEIFARR